MSSSKSRKESTEEGPVKKKAKGSSPSKQSNLLQFFGKPKPKSSAAKKEVQNDTDKRVKNEQDKSKHAKILEDKSEKRIEKKGTKMEKTDDSNSTSSSDVPPPIIPKQVSPNPKAHWNTVENCLLVRKIKEEPRTKAAAFDVDGTLLVWRIAGWPSQFQHYELWSSTIIDQLQTLHEENHKLVFFSNQGAIRGAFQGKKATFVKSLLEWLAFKIDRPVHMVLSTNKKMGYHKPNPGMWEICEQHCNRGIPIDIEQSFFVGDSVGDEDPQGGVDDKFAANIGELKGGTLKFFTPEEYFGPSDREKRNRQGAMSEYDAPPAASLQARKALLGGYLKGPLLLLLSGVQGSGKSTFCQQLLGDDQDDNTTWVHLSQDTINKGKPGKREAVEAATRTALQNGQSVVVDRTHLDPSQRKYFVDIAKEMKVPIHILVFQTPKELVTKRVQERTNHPGGVEGEKGVKIALMHLAKMVLPNYKDEGFDLITCIRTEEGTKRMSSLYRRVVHSGETNIPTAVTVPQTVQLACGIAMPTLALGTMKVGKRIGQDVVQTALELGWKAVDTAPTYNNEEKVGMGLADRNAFVIAKVPKRATQPEQVREELEQSLTKLNVKCVGLLLLHWPCDVMEAGTLQTVWKAMEQCVSDGKVKALGVCNCSVDALRQLLPHCTILPAVNQVERHPLLPQMELVEFCANQGIVLQAHSPLGQGKLLENETVVNVAKEAKVSPAQAILMWNLQHGVTVVPKCATKEHQQELLGVLDGGKVLSAEHMKRIDGIPERERFVFPPFMKAPGKVYAWKN